MPRPAYPPDWSTTVRGLQQGVRAAYTAAQTRVRYAAIRAASIIIGPQVGAQITIDPGGDGVLPHVRIASAGGDGYLVGEGDSVGIGSALRTTDDDQFGGISVGGGTAPAYVRAIITEGGEGRARMQLRATDAHLYASGEAEIRSGYAGGSSPYGVARTDTDGALLACYSATGAALATVRARADGTVVVYQSAAAATTSSTPTTFAQTARTAETTTVADPGQDADPAEQTAYLRALATAQAAELAELRARLDRMPRFEVATVDVDDQAEEGDR